MNEDTKQKTQNDKRERLVPTVSAVLSDGTILEMVFKSDERRTAFIVCKENDWREVSSYDIDAANKFIPYTPKNNLIKNQVVLLPSQLEEYGSEEKLISEIQNYIHRYVDLSPLFEKIATYYVLFSWVYDSFNELPYLRMRGDYGTGKSRFLSIVGSVCYKPIFASGASTVSPIFRTLDAFKGTLIVDEGDFRFSDEKAEIVKILNNGNVKGFPVLRSEVSDKGKEFNPRAYHVFGPKIVAQRGFFDDKALESRFITEEAGKRKLRDDVPINLPDIYKEESLLLRNKLLLFRFRNFGKHQTDAALIDRSIEPRLNQIFVPLLSIIKDESTRHTLKEVAKQYDREILNDRGTEVQAQVLEVIRDLLASDENTKPSVRDITKWFSDRFGEDYERKVTAKWIGSIIRKKLGIKTERSDHGLYFVPPAEIPNLNRLYKKYGIERPAAQVDFVDVVDFERGTEEVEDKENKAL